MTVFDLFKYGWLTPEKRLEYLGKVSNLTRVDAIKPWQDARLKTKLAGDQFWQFGVKGLSFGASTDVSTPFPFPFHFLNSGLFDFFQDGFTIFLDSPEAKELIFKHQKKVALLNLLGWVL